MTQNQPSGRSLLPSLTVWLPDQHHPAMLAEREARSPSRVNDRVLGFWGPILAPPPPPPIRHALPRTPPPRPPPPPPPPPPSLPSFTFVISKSGLHCCTDIDTIRYFMLQAWFCGDLVHEYAWSDFWNRVNENISSRMRNNSSALVAEDMNFSSWAGGSELSTFVKDSLERYALLWVKM